MSLKTFKTHRRLYFDEKQKTWTSRKAELEVTSQTTNTNGTTMEEMTSSSPPQSGSDGEDEDDTRHSPPAFQCKFGYRDIG